MSPASSPTQQLFLFTKRSKVLDTRQAHHYCLEVTHVETSIKESVCGYLPSPKASDSIGGRHKNVEMNGLSVSRLNKKGQRFGTKLQDTPFEKYHPLSSYSLIKPYLNPCFAEWMMNYPIGASNLKPLAMDKIQS